MSKKNEDKVSPISFTLPDNLQNMTIGQLIKNENAEINYKNGSLSIKNSTEAYTASFQLNVHNFKNNTSNNSDNRKKNISSEVIEMRHNGMTQSQIAISLGISQSYVSQILKRNIT